ncbi:hypothetical protein ACFV2B_11405 [Streptomyces lavendulae]
MPDQPDADEPGHELDGLVDATTAGSHAARRREQNNDAGQESDQDSDQ